MMELIHSLGVHVRVTFVVNFEYTFLALPNTMMLGVLEVYYYEYT